MSTRWPKRRGAWCGIPPRTRKVGGKMVTGRLYRTHFRPINHRQTRMELLTKAARMSGQSAVGLMINHLGGAGYDDPDVQWLLRRGYIRMARTAYAKVWASDLPYEKRADLRRTRAYATEAGRAVLATGKFPT